MEVPDQLADLTRLLAELSELLLNACAAACAAADPVTEASPIAREYEQSRQFALSALTSCAMQLCRAGGRYSPRPRSRLRPFNALFPVLCCIQDCRSLAVLCGEEWGG